MEFLDYPLSALCILLSFAAGVAVAGAACSEEARRAICVLYGGLVRIIEKALRTRRIPEKAVINEPDSLALSVSTDLADALSGIFGQRIASIYLFGSRARGDHVSTSDVDIAVFLHGRARASPVQHIRLWEQICRAAREWGVYVQCRLIRDGDGIDSLIAEGIQSDGILIEIDHSKRGPNRICQEMHSVMSG